MDSRLLKPTGNKFGGRVWPAASGYDLAAETYDQWYWQAFWRANEMPLVARELGTAAGGATALDAGTGTGQYLEVLQRGGYQTFGIDVSREMLQRARTKLGARATLVRGALQHCPFVTAAFDVVIACRVLSHIEGLDEATLELARVTRPGGRLLFTDVSEKHKYVTTRIPTSAGDVHIETYKHGAAEVLATARRFGLWELEFLKDVRFRDLVAPPRPTDYPSIDASSALPIFFYGAMRRR